MHIESQQIVIGFCGFGKNRRKAIMKKRRFLKRFLSLMSVMVVVLSFSVMGFSAAADEPIVIAIHNTDAKDDNPLIRVFMPKSTFGSGGPFTIKFGV